MFLTHPFSLGYKGVNKIILDFIIKKLCTIGSLTINNKLISKRNFHNQQLPKDLIKLDKVKVQWIIESN